MASTPMLINIPTHIPLREIEEALAAAGVAIEGSDSMKRIVQIPELIRKGSTKLKKARIKKPSKANLQY